MQIEIFIMNMSLVHLIFICLNAYRKSMVEVEIGRLRLLELETKWFRQVKFRMKLDLHSFGLVWFGLVELSFSSKRMRVKI